MHTNDEDDASRITAPWRAVVLLLSQALLCASGGGVAREREWEDIRGTTFGYKSHAFLHKL